MSNSKAVERFEQMHGAHIEKLFWIAASFDSSELKDVLEDFDEHYVQSLFPDIYSDENYQEYYSDNLLNGLTDFGKFGFLAQVYFPECSNFRFDEKGEYKGCMVSAGISRIDYAYGETIEELEAEIKKLSDKIFNEYMEKDKSKKAK